MLTANHGLAKQSRVTARGWLEPQQRPIILVRDDVDQTVRTLPHIANTLVQFGQQRFTAQLLHLLGDHDAFETTGTRHLAAARAADEQIALPRRKAITGVERHARRRDRWNPQNERLLDTGRERRL